MRILMCVSDAPLAPRHTGFRRQLTGLRAALNARHDVRLVGYRMPDQVSDPTSEQEMRLVPYHRPGLKENAADLAASLVSRDPIRAARQVNGLREPLLEELERFRPDVVHVGPGKLAGLLPDLGGLPAVLGVMDTWHLNVEARAATATALRRPVLRLDSRRIRRYEAKGYRGFDRVVVSNQGDLDALRAEDPTLPFEVIPIGFDASAYRPDPSATRDPSRIIFHGAMNYAPNIVAVEHLVERVLPLVLASRPDAHVVIVGRDPAPRVLSLSGHERVVVAGEVEDMRAELTRSRVWAGPFLSGTGIKTKLLEAMATDLPCVATPLGARGVDAVSGEHLLIGASEEELAEHLVRVLSEDETAERIGRAGGGFVRPRYDWPAVAVAYERLYEQVINERQQSAHP